MRFISALWALWALFLAAAHGCSNNGTYQCLVVFGDSYSDYGRAYSFVANGRAPPPGTIFPVDCTKTFVGGCTWPAHVYYQKQGCLNVINYSCAGAMLDPQQIPHTYNGGPSQDVLEYQIPTYKAEAGNPTIFSNCTPANTVHAMWIGANDWGLNGFLGDSEFPQTNTESWVNSTFTVWDEIYKKGGRRFVLFYVPPLDLLPTYNQPGQWGYDNYRYYSNPATYNTTEFLYKANIMVRGANSIYKCFYQYQTLFAKRWPGANFVLFDVAELLRKIFSNPDLYFDTPSSSLTPYENCRIPGCPHGQYDESHFMYFEEYHISNRTSEIVAQNFDQILQGLPNPYGITLSS